MASRWSVPPARERGEVLLASGPSGVFHCIYSFPSAIAAVLFGGLATCLVLDPGKATQAELVIGTILLAGLGFLFFAGFVWCRRFGVWATRRGVLVRYIPGRTKFLPWAAIAAFEPGMHDGVELRSLTARMVDGTTHMVPIFYRTDGQRDFLSSTITPEGARYVGSNVNPAVVLPQLLDLYRQGRLGV